MTHVDLFTDGSSRGNPGPGGYGLILRSGSHQKEISQGFKHTTNNRMELMAVIVGLESLKTPCAVRVISDSKYVVDAIEKQWIQGWVKRSWKNVKNPDLWQRYLLSARTHRVRFEWIKGHNNHSENERCDQLATEAALQGPHLDDPWAKDSKP